MKEGRALVALIILFFMVVIDPVISYVRRRWYDDTPYYSPPRRTFLGLAFGVPVMAVIAGLTVSLFRIEDYRRGLLIMAIQLLFGWILGRYFFDRAKGRTARLGDEAVEPDNTEFANDFHDFLALIAALALVAAPVIFFW